METGRESERRAVGTTGTSVQPTLHIAAGDDAGTARFFRVPWSAGCIASMATRRAWGPVLEMTRQA